MAAGKHFFILAGYFIDIYQKVSFTHRRQTRHQTKQYDLIQNACPYKNFMKHIDICALDIPHIVLEIISFIYFSTAVHTYTIVHKCSPSPTEHISINKNILQGGYRFSHMEYQQGPQEGVALELEVSRETRSLKDIT